MPTNSIVQGFCLALGVLLLIIVARALGLHF